MEVLFIQLTGWFHHQQADNSGFWWNILGRCWWSWVQSFDLFCGISLHHTTIVTAIGLAFSSTHHTAISMALLDPLSFQVVTYQLLSPVLHVLSGSARYPSPSDPPSLLPFSVSVTLATFRQEIICGLWFQMGHNHLPPPLLALSGLVN